MITDTMIERENRLRSTWIDEGDGYFSMYAFYISPLAYIALPENHPDIGKSGYDLDPDVNGGITFNEENVFGWDYAHGYNTFDITGDIHNALEYFRERAKQRVISAPTEQKLLPREEKNWFTEGEWPPMGFPYKEEE